jgi:hypothetical protein
MDIELILDTNPKHAIQMHDYLFIFHVFSKKCVTSNFAKLYHYYHMVWRLGPTAIWYGGWRCYCVPNSISHDVCEQYPVQVL